MNIYTIIVTYNAKNWIDKCFESLISSNIETRIIAIDNGSNDGSSDIIRKKYPQAELIENGQNLGFGKANNIGIRQAYDDGADYVFLLNQDAWIKNDTIEKLTRIHSIRPKYGIISPIHLNGTGSALDKNFSKYIAPQVCRNLYSDKWLNQLKDDVYELPFVIAAAWLISRKCIETEGGFNPLFFFYGEDNNYIERVKYHKLKIGVFPDAYIYHDREDRPRSLFKEDQQHRAEKELLLTYCNPAGEEDINEYVKKIVQTNNPIKKILRLQFKEVRKSRNEIEKIKIRAKEITKAQALSKSIGKSFL